MSSTSSPAGRADTVYKAIKPQANAAAQVAIDIINGKTPKTNGKVSGTPSVLLTPIWLTKANYKKVFTDGLPQEERRLHRPVRQVLQVQQPPGGAA